MKYVIASGYSEGKLGADVCRRFYPLWLSNTFETSYPEHVYIVTAGVGLPVHDARVVQIPGAVNLGHVHQMEHGPQLGGWSMGFVIGCMMAYHANADLIYKEQDCLAFGAWVERLYHDGRDADVVTGHHNVNGDGKGLLAQSLVLVKHHALLPLVARYLAISKCDKELITENKMEQALQGMRWAKTSMGHDRSRPIGYDALPFYAQQLTFDEIKELSHRGLL